MRHKYHLDTYAMPFASTANITFTQEPLWTQNISPPQLTRAQVAQINSASNGQPRGQTTVTIRADGIFESQVPLRENDVFLLMLEKQHRRPKTIEGRAR